MPSAPDRIQAIQRGEFPPPPVADLIGFTLTAVEPGRAVIELDANARHANPMGTVHGGILCDIADAAMGIAYAAGLDEGETFTALELKINFLKPVRTGHLTAIGRVVKSCSGASMPSPFGGAPGAERVPRAWPRRAGSACGPASRKR